MYARVRKSWIPSTLLLVLGGGTSQAVNSAALAQGTEALASSTEAPTGFDELTNGLTTQDQFNADRDKFNEQEQIADGLGPGYNAQSCGECHQNPVSGSSSQISELRAGRFRNGTFTEHPGGSIVHSRAIYAAIQDQLMRFDSVRTFRMSLSTLGDGFVESIPDETLADIATHQPPNMRGQLISVPVLEAKGASRAGRFGWKNQHASLVSFAADAYLNDMGITSSLQPTETTSDGLSG